MFQMLIKYWGTLGYILDLNIHTIIHIFGVGSVYYFQICVIRGRSRSLTHINITHSILYPLQGPDVSK